MGNIGTEDGYVILERVVPEEAEVREMPGADEGLQLAPAEAVQLEAALDEQPA